MACNRGKRCQLLNALLPAPPLFVSPMMMQTGVQPAPSSERINTVVLVKRN
jgi:hypothetical protein